MSENYYAVLIWIFTDVSPEIALRKMRIYAPIEPITEEDKKYIIRLKSKGLTYKTISGIYYRDKKSIYRICKLSKEKGE